MDIRMKKTEMLAALEARRPWAKAADERNAAKHKLAEKAYFKVFRDRLREALKWDYATAREKSFQVPFGRYNDDPRRPSCPTSYVTLLDYAIRQVNQDSRKHICAKENPRGSDKLHYLLTYDDADKRDVCA